MRQSGNSSFEFFEPDQLEKAGCVDKLISVYGNNPHKTGGETWSCAWAPDLSYFGWSCGYRIVHLIPWDAGKRKKQDPADQAGLSARQYHLIDCGDLVWSLAFGSGTSHSSRQVSLRRNRFDQNLILATGLASGEIKLWDCSTGQLIIKLQDHKDVVRSLSFSSDGSLQLISASHDGSIKLWDLTNDGNMYQTLRFPQAKHFFACKLSRNMKYIAAGGSSRSAILWTISISGFVAKRLEGHANDVVSVDFSPDSALLATASHDTAVILWDPDTCTMLRKLGHLHPFPRLIYAGGANDHHVRSVSFCRDGTSLASVADDGFARLWRLGEMGDPAAIATVDGAISCSFSPDASCFAVGCRNGHVEILDGMGRPPSLSHLCRMVVRRAVSSPAVEELPLPSALKRFLRYRDYTNDDSLP